MFQGNGEEFILGSRPHRPDRGENPTSPLEDVEVVQSLHSEGELFFPSFGEAHVGMRVHEAGNEGKSFAVNFYVNLPRGKPFQHLLFRPNGFDHPIPAAEGSMLKVSYLALAFSGQGSPRVGGRRDGGISKELSAHAASSASIWSSRSSST